MTEIASLVVRIGADTGGLQEALGLAVRDIDTFEQRAAESLALIDQQMQERLGGILGGVGSFFQETVNLYDDKISPFFDDAFKGIADRFAGTFDGIRLQILQPVSDSIARIQNQLAALAQIRPVDLSGAAAVSGGDAPSIGPARWASGISSSMLPGHYDGLDYVPYDGYVARLHQGERVMTARENQTYSAGETGGVVIQSVTINAGTYESGQRAADGFEQRLGELFRAKGVRA